MKISEYRIIEEDTLKGLTREVNEQINEGWTPLGGVSAVEAHEDEYDDGTVLFYQAMGKVDEV